MKNVTKVNKKETVKNVITEEQLLKMSNEDLVNVDLDNLNLNSIIAKRVTARKKTETSKIDLYKGLNNLSYNDMDKKQKSSFRKQTRNKRNAFINSFLSLQNANNTKDIKVLFKDFKTFYIERYTLNDFSLTSLSRQNADKDTILDINIMLAIFKKLNLK